MWTLRVEQWMLITIANVDEWMLITTTLCQGCTCARNSLFELEALMRKQMGALTLEALTPAEEKTYLINYVRRRAALRMGSSGVKNVRAN